MHRSRGGSEMLDSSYIKLGFSGFAKGWMWSVKEREIKNDSEFWPEKLERRNESHKGPVYFFWWDLLLLPMRSYL